MKIYWKPLIISLIISLGTGAFAGFLSRGSMSMYNNLLKPDISPPGWVFPIVWTILYILMGISAYLIFTSGSPKRKQALYVYFLQLAVNFIWPLLFFNLEAFDFAFFWLLLLWVLIAITIKEMYNVNKVAAYLLIPYLLWVTFAGYLNYEIAKLT